MKNIKNVDKKNRIVPLIIGMFIFIIFILGATFAWFTFSTNNTIIAGTSVCFNVSYSKGSDITGDLDVTASYTGGRSTTFTVSETDGCVYGNGYVHLNTLSGTSSTYFQNNCSIDPNTNNTESLCTEAGGNWGSPLKYALLDNNNNILNEGTITTLGDIEIGSFPLSTTATMYTIYIWLDGNHATNSHVGLAYKGSIYVEAVQGTLDTSGANPPKMVDGMIPVYYDSTSSVWRIADIDNADANYKWYDYNDKQWANMVLVSDTNRNTYTNQANVGQEVDIDDILAFYVWIPRYKYKVWNIDRTATDSYGARTNGVDIVFETNTNTTGSITCYYDFSLDPTTTANEVCTGSAGDYYTHPAFWWDDDGDDRVDEGEELTGFWMAKFEASSDTSGTNTTVRVLPNKNSWRDISISVAFTVAHNMQSSSNIYGIYGLPKTIEALNRKTVDSHLVKMMEWGAVSYLSHSNYGLCSNGNCAEINSNYTGPAGEIITGSQGRSNFVYNTSEGMTASTTGTVYGIYDMAGGAWELSMTNSGLNGNSYTFSTASSGFTANPGLKYLTIYKYGTSYDDQSAYNRGRLGDIIMAGWEVEIYDFLVNLNSWLNLDVYLGSADGMINNYSFSGGNASIYTGFRLTLS